MIRHLRTVGLGDSPSTVLLQTGSWVCVLTKVCQILQTNLKELAGIEMRQKSIFLLVEQNQNWLEFSLIEHREDAFSVGNNWWCYSKCHRTGNPEFLITEQWAVSLRLCNCRSSISGRSSLHRVRLHKYKESSGPKVLGKAQTSPPHSNYFISAPPRPSDQSRFVKISIEPRGTLSLA